MTVVADGDQYTQLQSCLHRAPSPWLKKVLHFFLLWVDCRISWFATKIAAEWLSSQTTLNLQLQGPLMPLQGFSGFITVGISLDSGAMLPVFSFFGFCFSDKEKAFIRKYKAGKELEEDNGRPGGFGRLP